jgi:hypothetical protein
MNRSYIPRVKHTPNCLHPYTVTQKGNPIYGWGNTPQEARECFDRKMREESERLMREKYKGVYQ